jgi:hypothetical protein
MSTPDNVTWVGRRSPSTATRNVTGSWGAASGGESCSDTDPPRTATPQPGNAGSHDASAASAHQARSEAGSSGNSHRAPSAANAATRPTVPHRGRPAITRPAITRPVGCRAPAR